MTTDFNNKFKKLYKEKCSNFPYQPNKLPHARRIVAIGDVHGDINLVYKALKLAKVINSKYNWTSDSRYSDTIIVQLGDQVDSCRPSPTNLCSDKNYLKNDTPNDIKILKYFTILHNQAQKYGGAVYSILGNHELMNVDGNTAYVSYKNLNDDSFDQETPFKNPVLARKYAFSPGNKIANFLACTRKTALIIGNNLFVHAGIVPAIANKYNVDDINSILGLYLMNELEDTHKYYDILGDPTKSPLWNRLYNKKLTHNECNKVKSPLTKFYKIDNMYVGHNPQLYEGINSICDNSIWRTDTGNSSAFEIFHQKNTKSRIQALEILTDLDTYQQKFTVLEGKR